MSETVTLVLPRDFAGQILDGIEVLIEQWEATGCSLDGEYVEEGVCTRECSHSAEAWDMAEYYGRIRELLVLQMKQGRGSG